jgi:hypothetical protein
MALDLARTQKTPDRLTILEDIRAQLFSSDTWTVTEIVQTREGPRNLAFSVAIGERTDPSTKAVMRFPHEAVKRQFRLHVLCTKALKLTRDEFDAREWSDVRPGDVVRFKIATKSLNAAGRPITQSDKREMLLRGVDLIDYHEAKLDADCCVAVDFEMAYNALIHHGKELTFPEFDRIRDGEKDSHGKPVRKISNWWFEEVAADWHAPKRDAVSTGRR